MTNSRKPLPEMLPVDERLVMPEQGFEIVDGEVVEVRPAEEPHGRGHSKLAAVLEAHVIDGWTVAVDMLTRMSKMSDAAPDVSVYPEARDPLTGGRQLEALAFEVLSSQSLGAAKAKAGALAERGVRRVFAIDVRRGRVLEWSSETEEWALVPTSGSLTDPLFVLPIPLADLLSAVRADDAVARALLAKGNPVIEAALVARLTNAREEARDEGRKEGRRQGREEMLRDLIASRGWHLSPAQEQVLAEAPDARLRSLAQAVMRAETLDAVFEID